MYFVHPYLVQGPNMGEDRGIIPRAIEKIMEEAKRLGVDTSAHCTHNMHALRTHTLTGRTASSLTRPHTHDPLQLSHRKNTESDGWTYSLDASFLEIYNECVRWRPY